MKQKILNVIKRIIIVFMLLVVFKYIVKFIILSTPHLYSNFKEQDLGQKIFIIFSILIFTYGLFRNYGQIKSIKKLVWLSFKPVLRISLLIILSVMTVGVIGFISRSIVNNISNKYLLLGFLLINLLFFSLILSFILRKILKIKFSEILVTISFFIPLTTGILNIPYFGSITITKVEGIESPSKFISWILVILFIAYIDKCFKYIYTQIIDNIVKVDFKEDSEN